MIFFGVNMPSSRTHSKMHRKSLHGRIIPRFHCFPGKIKVKMMESHSPKLLVTLFPRHQNKKQRFLDFTISILSSGKKMCTCSIFIFFGMFCPQRTKIMFPELLFSRFPSRTTHTFKDLLKGVDGEEELEMAIGNGQTCGWGGSRESIVFSSKRAQKGDRCIIEYHLIYQIVIKV